MAYQNEPLAAWHGERDAIKRVDPLSPSLVTKTQGLDDYVLDV